MDATELHRTTDGAVWAREFCDIAKKTGADLDEDWVIGWFANAIECGRSHGAEPGRKFKEYVHQRLDDAGVPAHPEGPHSAEGCRVGDRLDIALAIEPAARKVFDGLNARIDFASQMGGTVVPVFAGIADLSDALNRMTHSPAPVQQQDESA